MSATDSDSSEKVAALARNGWPSCSGFGGRHGSELMAVLLRIMHHDMQGEAAIVMDKLVTPILVEIPQVKTKVQKKD